MESDNDANTLVLEIKKDDDKSWSSCLVYSKPIDYPTHTYFSSGSKGQQVNRSVTINSIKFYDNEVEMEGEILDWIQEKEYRDIKSSAQDLLHLGNVDGVLLVDEQKGRESYNDKLLKYNSKYA